MELQLPSDLSSVSDEKLSPARTRLALLRRKYQLSHQLSNGPGERRVAAFPGSPYAYVAPLDSLAFRIRTRSRSRSRPKKRARMWAGLVSGSGRVVQDGSVGRGKDGLGPWVRMGAWVGRLVALLTDPARELRTQPAGQRYRRLSKLGRGHFGDVYLAQEVSSSRILVVKSVRRRDSAVAPARQEARCLLRLRAHPNIIKIYDIFEDGPDNLALVMDYADGGDLSMRIARARDARTPLRSSEAMHTFVQVASALVHIHKVGIVHRDIKPGNIFLTLQGIVRLGDFGIADASINSGAAGGQSKPVFGIVGTPLYASPEVCKGEPLGKPTDLWSLGAVLYEMLALAPPFKENCLPLLVRAIVLKEVAPLSGLPAGSDTSAGATARHVELQQLVSGLLAKLPERRLTAEAALQTTLCRQLAYRYRAADLRRSLAQETRLHQKLDAWSARQIGGPNTGWSKDTDWSKGAYGARPAQSRQPSREKLQRKLSSQEAIPEKEESRDPSAPRLPPPRDESDPSSEGEGGSTRRIATQPSEGDYESMMDVLQATADSQTFKRGGLKVRAVMRLAAGALVAQSRRHKQQQQLAEAAALNAKADAVTDDATAHNHLVSLIVEPVHAAVRLLGASGAGALTRAASAMHLRPKGDNREALRQRVYRESSKRLLAAPRRPEGRAASNEPELERRQSRGRREAKHLRKTYAFAMPFDAELAIRRARSLSALGSSLMRSKSNEKMVPEPGEEPELWKGSLSAPPLNPTARRTAKALTTYACADATRRPGQLWVSCEHVCFSVPGGARVLIHVGRIEAIEMPRPLLFGRRKASRSLRFVLRHAAPECFYGFTDREAVVESALQLAARVGVEVRVVGRPT